MTNDEHGGDVAKGLAAEGAWQWQELIDKGVIQGGRDMPKNRPIVGPYYVDVTVTFETRVYAGELTGTVFFAESTMNTERTLLKRLEEQFGARVSMQNHRREK